MTAGKKANANADIAAVAMAAKGGSDIVAIDLSEQLVLSEIFLIATGNNERQIDAISDAVQEKLAEFKEKPLRKESTAEWILLDYSDLVVHIQSQALRQYYMLDRLWNDCPRVELPELSKYLAEAATYPQGSQ